MTQRAGNSDRREFLGNFAAIGLGSSLLPGVLWSRLHAGLEITPASLAAAEEIAGVSLTDAQRDQVLRNVKGYRATIDALHKVSLDNGVAPAFSFDPLPPGMPLPVKPRGVMKPSRVPLMASPSSVEELAFAQVTVLSDLVKRRKVTALALTDMYLARLRRFDPLLHCVITLTENRARTQAKALDAETQRGKHRGPLHGIPWGAKDLLSARGYPTTWGAGPYKTQVIDRDATVVSRLDDAGAILIAKLSLGELAQGDVWFGAVTRNPWWPEQGSSGSSAGPASATAAGLVGFAIGTETLGSISSPSTRCGTTGLRPTFGRVPRTGAMALSWSMDKIGPICRNAEDCALVLAAIQGPDGLDRTVKDVAFPWDAQKSVKALRVGYIKSAFDLPERDPKNPDRIVHGLKPYDDAALDVLRNKLGVTLIPVELPDINAQALGVILQAEAGAAFDEVTRNGRIDEMVQHGPGDWPTTFRASRFIPAVVYINAMRVRTLALEKWRNLFHDVDVIVTPTNAAGQLTATNMTGHPAVILPHGFREAGVLGPGIAASAVPGEPWTPPATPAPSPRPQVPVSLTILGGLYDDEKALALAHAYQSVTDFHLKHPALA